MRSFVCCARALVSSALLLLVLVAPPLVLARIAGSPVVLVCNLAAVHWSQPDGTDVRSVLIVGLGLLCWLSWCRVTVAIGIEWACALRLVRRPRVRVLGGAQALASLLIGGVTSFGLYHAPSAASSGSLAVAVRPAGLELAWADTAVLAAGTVAAVASTRRAQRRRAATAVAAPAPTAPPVPPKPPLLPTRVDVEVASPQASPLHHPDPDAQSDMRPAHEPAAVRSRLERAAGAATGPRAAAPAAVPGPIPAPAPLTVPHRAPDPGANLGPTLAPVPDWAFMVRVLGPVDVLDRAGAPVSFERSKSVEFLAWVVLHRRSATREAARAALWETDVRDASFANVVSEARRGLSRHLAPEGHREWLGRPHGELVPLHPAVVSDVEVFRAHVSRADTLRRHGADEERVAAELRAALELVRGAPFIGSGFAWADAEASTSGCTLLVVNAALELGELDLAAGRVEDAFRSAGVGLCVLPGHEELVALRLRTHARSGDLVGVRHEWNAYLRSLANDTWQSEPSAWLEELVRDLAAEPATTAH